MTGTIIYGWPREDDHYHPGEDCPVEVADSRNNITATITGPAARAIGRHLEERIHAD